MRLAMRALIVCAALCIVLRVPCASAGVNVSATHALVYVAGREVAFERLGIAYNDPVAPAGDRGLRQMLDLVGAQMSWQAGTRFVAITRADGKLITLTVGSDALSVDGKAVAMPFAPFYRDSDLYLPLLPLAKALQLGVRGFRGGYVLVPQVVSIDARSDAKRTVVQIMTSAPAAYRSAYDARQNVLRISFPGFGTDALGTIPLSGRDGLDVKTTQDGPPGYPTTTVAIDMKRGMRFAAHRVIGVLAVDAVLAKTEPALRLDDGSSAVGRVTRTDKSTPVPATPPPATPSPAPHSMNTPVPTAHPAMTATPAAAASSPPPQQYLTRLQVRAAFPTPAPSVSPSAPVPSGSPAQAQAEPTEAGSPSPTPTPAEQRITDVSLAEVPNGGTRITLTLTGGPVSFEWHRLDDPDNRFWLDIKGVTLVGPAEAMSSALPFVKAIRITQFALEPEKIVRITIDPTQPIDVNIGPVAQSTNQMGVEIERTPPNPDAPKAGVGAVAWVPSSSPPSPWRTPTQRDLVVLDPGHGGSDPGAMNTEAGLTESRLTLAISLKLRDELRRRGWRVIMTREQDTEVGDPSGNDKQELQARCDVGNEAGARVFVSVHINASTTHSLNGTTTYYWRPADKAFATVIQNAIVAADGIYNAGVKRQQFYVIHHTLMPAVLVETAFLSNPHDAALLAQPGFLDKLALGIANGIMDFTGGPQAPLGQARLMPSTNS